jgi:hypothetical protein
MVRPSDEFQGPLQVYAHDPWPQCGVALRSILYYIIFLHFYALFDKRVESIPNFEGMVYHSAG